MKPLKNRYFALRHGESKANVAEIIVSDLQNGIQEEFTLTQNGENQVRGSVVKAKTENLLDENTIIYSSPFSRCKKTAEIAKEVLGLKNEVIIDGRLQERWFGDLNKAHVQNYQKIWAADKENQQPIQNEEPVEKVKERTMSLVADLEEQYSGKAMLLVSHGDVLQVLEVCLLGMPAHNHRDIRPLEKAEIRELHNLI